MDVRGPAIGILRNTYLDVNICTYPWAKAVEGHTLGLGASDWRGAVKGDGAPTLGMSVRLRGAVSGVSCICQRSPLDVIGKAPLDCQSYALLVSEASPGDSQWCPLGSSAELFVIVNGASLGCRWELLWVVRRKHGCRQ